MPKPYNTTDLDPETTFQRHVFHRDQFAHYLRWTHVLREVKIGERIIDFGGGKGNLLEVLYRNKYKPSLYADIDIRKQTIEKAQEKYKNVPFETEWVVADLTDQGYDWSRFDGDRVCSFEVIEHVGKQNAQKFLKNFKLCGGDSATYYLSTPNYDPDVGAAGNHTYDSGDGRGLDVQEFDHYELQAEIEKAGFKIINKFGTFASQKDYVESLNEWQTEMYYALKKYYDSNLVSNIMAPVVEPELSRNCLWVLKK